MSVNTKTDIYTDLNSLKNLKSSARKDSNSALPEAARQFEAVMISMMIKNLRKSGMEDPIFKSQAMDSYRDMYDQQLGLELSKGEGIGFAKAIVEQMQYQQGKIKPPSSEEGGLQLPERRNFSYQRASEQAFRVKNPSTSVNPVQTTKNLSAQFESPQHFVEKLWPLAEKAAQKLDVSAEIILSQSALETGWGQHIISDGPRSSYNLFNIKANNNWSGEQVEKNSAEFSDSIKDSGRQIVQQKSHFRVYDSFAQSFDDYVDFIKNSPRYQTYLNKLDDKTGKAEQSLHDERYIKGIHKAGYATDPAYSDKVLRVLKSDTIQNQLINQVHQGQAHQNQSHNLTRLASK